MLMKTTITPSETPTPTPILALVLSEGVAGNEVVIDEGSVITGDDLVAVGNDVVVPALDGDAVLAATVFLAGGASGSVDKRPSSELLGLLVVLGVPGGSEAVTTTWVTKTSVTSTEQDGVPK